MAGCSSSSAALYHHSSIQPSPHYALVWRECLLTYPQPSHFQATNERTTENPQIQQQTEQDQGIWSYEEQYRWEDRSHEQHHQEKMKEFEIYHRLDMNNDRDMSLPSDEIPDAPIVYHSSFDSIILPSPQHIKHNDTVVTRCQDNRRTKWEYRRHRMRCWKSHYASLIRLIIRYLSYSYALYADPTISHNDQNYHSQSHLHSFPHIPHQSNAHNPIHHSILILLQYDPDMYSQPYS